MPGQSEVLVFLKPFVPEPVKIGKPPNRSLLDRRPVPDQVTAISSRAGRRRYSASSS